MTNLDSVFKSRDITLPTKVHLVKAMFFPVGMYRCENWTIKKAEYRRIDAFELWFWRRLLRVPWTARRDNQSILREISPEYSLEGLMLKLKLQYFSHLMRKTDSLEKTLMLVKNWGQEEKGVGEGKMVGWYHWFNAHEFEQPLGDSERQGKPGVLHTVHGVAKSWTRLSKWTTTYQQELFSPLNLPRLWGVYFLIQLSSSVEYGSCHSATLLEFRGFLKATISNFSICKSLINRPSEGI